MANPQVESGHTKIANEILEALCRINLTAHESRLLWCILRKTYGWNKKADRISYSQFQESTGIDRRHVGRALTSLKKRNVIICEGEGYCLEYGLQKDYELWIFATVSGNDLPPSEATIKKEICHKDRQRFDTRIGNDLPPSEATIKKEICHHPGNDLPPSWDNLPPSEATNLPPSEAMTNTIKHITNTYDKRKGPKQSFEEYRDSLKIKYTDIDFDHEVEKFLLYWDGHDKKHTSKNPKLGLVNWMDRARSWKLRDESQDGNNGRTGIDRADSKPHVSRYGATTTEELQRSVGRPIE